MKGSDELIGDIIALGETTEGFLSDVIYDNDYDGI